MPIETGSTVQSEIWITDQRQIARLYLKGWFPLDFGSVVPSAFDIIAVAQHGNAEVDLSRFKVCRAVDGATAGDPPLIAARCPPPTTRCPPLITHHSPQALRVVRVLRLVKLVKLVRASRLIRRWEMRVAVNYSALSVIVAAVMVILVIHWLTCAWSMQARLRRISVAISVAIVTLFLAMVTSSFLIITTAAITITTTTNSADHHHQHRPAAAVNCPPSHAVIHRYTPFRRRNCRRITSSTRGSAGWAFAGRLPRSTPPSSTTWSPAVTTTGSVAPLRRISTRRGSIGP